MTQKNLKMCHRRKKQVQDKDIHHNKKEKFLKKIEIGGKDAKYALMTTCLDYKTKSLEIMEDFLQPKKITKVSKGVKIRVAGVKGPLESGYKEKIDSFVEEIFSDK